MKKNKGILSAADILGANDLKTELVACPEWGGDVCLKSMTGLERDRFELGMTKKGKNGKRENDTDNLRAKLVAACAVDEKGKQLFTEAQALELGAKNAKALDRCFDAASALNGMFEADIKVAEKNS